MKKQGDLDGTLMNSTFPKRRRDVLGYRRGETAMSVAKLIKTYPALLETEEFLREFNRIVHGVGDGAADLRERLSSWLGKVEAASACAKDEAAETLARVVGGRDAFVESDDTSPKSYPTIQDSGEGGCHVALEGVVICRSSSAADALLVWGASFHVFDRKCSYITKNLCWFFRKYIFLTPIEDAKPEMRAVREIEALNN